MITYNLNKVNIEISIYPASIVTAPPPQFPTVKDASLLHHVMKTRAERVDHVESIPGV